MRETVINAIAASKLIVIVRGVDPAAFLPLAEALYAGGVRAMECTYDASGRIPDEAVARGIGALAEHFGDTVHVGAGTVLTQEQVTRTAAAGGRFIISPDTDPAVIAKTREEGLVSIPGAFTPTEIKTAHASGADYVKVFPVTALGPHYIKDIRAPLSHIRLLAVGGITPENVRDYLDAGVCGVGVSSGILDKKLLAAGDYAGITNLARAFTAQF